MTSTQSGTDKSGKQQRDIPPFNLKNPGKKTGVLYNSLRW